MSCGWAIPGSLPGDGWQVTPGTGVSLERRRASRRHRPVDRDLARAGRRRRGRRQADRAGRDGPARSAAGAVRGALRRRGGHLGALHPGIPDAHWLFPSVAAGTGLGVSESTCRRWWASRASPCSPTTLPCPSARSFPVGSPPPVWVPRPWVPRPWPLKACLPRSPPGGPCLAAGADANRVRGFVRPGAVVAAVAPAASWSLTREGRPSHPARHRLRIRTCVRGEGPGHGDAGLQGLLGPRRRGRCRGRRLGGAGRRPW